MSMATTPPPATRTCRTLHQESRNVKATMRPTMLEQEPGGMMVWSIEAGRLPWYSWPHLRPHQDPEGDLLWPCNSRHPTHPTTSQLSNGYDATEEIVLQAHSSIPG
ncbi:hypothetical protein Hamer_G027000 [Homarus americanus]|uniref:Uncharacterized protein n=1 Tax=Homarus americanus TaxID=6706 RepID=A0A8J5JV22_HOMAM|nr:hypothetical protein Hamer_G027000 [Homarus americanus]